MAWTDPRLERKKQREEQVRAAGIFGETYIDGDGETRSYAAFAPAALEVQQQIELELPGRSKNAVIRERLAEKFEREVIPLAFERHGILVDLDMVPRKLRRARMSGTYGIRHDTGKGVTFWDEKACLSRLCPDDAREESMRMARKYVPAIEAQMKGGRRQAHYAVLTTPNVERGKLRHGIYGMDHIFLRFKKLLKAKNKDGELLFPQIKGALCVLEAPLGRSRDWNVHLNVIFTTEGFFDWKALRDWWYWDLHVRQLTDAPGAIRGALAELIKYAVAATSSKSAKKAEILSRSTRVGVSLTEADAVAAPTREPGANVRSQGSVSNCVQGEPLPQPTPNVAPPMLEWTADELLEWWLAFHQPRFRRTRSYGVLFRVAKPEKEKIGAITWVGTVRYVRGRFVCDPTLLRSIPGDNFSGMSGSERWQAMMRMLDPAGLVGAGTLGESIPPMTQLTL